MRYSLIHYIYTAFSKASTEGVPIMRPMFLDFPKQESLFNVENQFMFGDSILVTPKLNEPASDQTTVDVVAILPNEVNWFNYNTKLAASESIMDMKYSDLDLGMWVRGGSILPILLHENALSVLRAISKPIKLEVFPN